MTEPTSPLLTALSNGRRRRILASLAHRKRSVHVTDLAAVLDAEEADDRAPATDGGRRREILLDLRHVHLPALASGGLIEYDDETGAVSAASPLAEIDDVPPLDDPGSVDESDERVFEALSKPRRRTVVSILRGTDDAHSLEALGADVAERESTPGESVTTEDVLVSLHHADLPKLDDAGVVEYDQESKTVEYREDAEFADWLDLSPDRRDGASDVARSETSQTPT